MSTMMISQSTMDAMKLHTLASQRELLKMAADAGLLTCDVAEAERQLNITELELKVEAAPAKVVNAKKAPKEKKTKEKKAKDDSDSEDKPKATRKKSGNSVFRSDPETKAVAAEAVKVAKDKGEKLNTNTVKGEMWKKLSDEERAAWQVKADESATSSAAASADESE